MKGEGYKTTPNEETTEFHFDSVGKQGTIRKKIIYFHLGENTWNLGFGDEEGDEIDDSVVSNNHDLRMVMQTVANTVYLFTEKYPERRIYIRPVDDRRKMLYNAVFKRRHSEILSFFTVYGRLQNSLEEYNPKKTYDAFFVIRKKG